MPATRRFPDVVDCFICSMATWADWGVSFPNAMQMLVECDVACAKANECRDLTFGEVADKLSEAG